MYKKKELPNEVYENNNYNFVNYSGAAGILFKINHFLLNFGVHKKFNENILEIGGGAKPHINFLNNFKNVKSYTIIDDIKFQYVIEDLKLQFKDIKFELIDYRDEEAIREKKGKFTRLISSHCFEHITNFEDVFLKYLKLMKEKSLLSIALPCDPGITWRLLQFISYFKQKKIYKWKSFKEKDLDDSRDHVTSVQNILKVLNFYFKNIKFLYFPFLIPITWINIFVIINIKLKNFNFNECSKT